MWYLVRGKISKFASKVRDILKRVEFGLGDQAICDSISRWVSVALLASVGVAVSLLLAPALVRVQIFVDDNFPSFNEWVVFCALCLLLLVGSFPFSKFLRLKHITTFRSYPPTWFAAFVAFPVVGFFLEFETALVVWTEILFFSVVLITGLLDVLASFWQSRRARKKKLDITQGTNAEISEDMESLFTWINNDLPISHPSQDVFNVSSRAIAAARTIASDNFRSLGVIGEFGVGKSSFVNLMEHHLLEGVVSEELRHNFPRWSIARLMFGVPRIPRFVFVKAKMWGLLNNSTEKFVLSAVVDALSRHVDCMRVTSIPETYAGLIKGDKSGLLNALMHFSGSGRPTDQLQKLEPILGACNIRLVIVIEDLDRNLGQPSVSLNQVATTNVPSGSIEFNTSLASSASKDKLAEFQALLDAVKEVEGLSFVFCSGPTR